LLDIALKIQNQKTEKPAAGGRPGARSTLESAFGSVEWRPDAREGLNLPGRSVSWRPGARSGARAPVRVYIRAVCVF
jgi:hypothetical protein